MFNSFVGRSLALLGAMLSCNNALAVPVIPGAAGFGTDTPAGRGGKIIRVTNLNASGAGSLRACVDASGPRVCVFDVSGTITHDSFLTVTKPYLTIAGQTAPAPGIMLRGATLVVAASDVLIQHLAVRAGDDPDGPDPRSRDSLRITKGARNVVVDHCSLSWSLDETFSTHNEWDNVTVSNTLVSEALNTSRLHAYAALVHTTNPSSRISFVGNLIAHNDARNPRTNAARFVFVNNVVYNPGKTGVMLFNTSDLPSDNTIVGNVFIKGSDTTSLTRPVRLNDPGVDGGNEMLPNSTLYMTDNVSWLDSDDPAVLIQNKSSLSLDQILVKSAPVWPTGLKALPASGGTVLNHVLKNAGSRPAQRDSVDARIISDVKNGTGRIINCVSSNGSEECSKNAGGWPSYARNTRVLKLPSDPNGDHDGDGYTNLEEWLHSMAAELEGTSGNQFSDAAPPLPPTLQD